METDEEVALVKELRRYKGVEVLLKECGAVSRIKKSEEMFLISLCGEMHHLGMSKGEIRNGTTRIMEGPLLGMEDRICRIDRHKRLARLAVPGSAVSKGYFEGNEFSRSLTLGNILAGLEIVEKN